MSENRTMSKAVMISAAVIAAAAAVTFTPGEASAQGYYGPPPGYEPHGRGHGYGVPPSVAQSGPRRINDWNDGEPIPPGYHRVTRIRQGLVIGGALTFGITYLATALIGAAASDIGKATCDTPTSCSTGRSAKLLLIPVAGPFTLLSTGWASADFFLVLNGLVQTAGVGMLIGGIAAPKTILVRNDLAKIEIKPTPMTFGQNSAGFGFTGTF